MAKLGFVYDMGRCTGCKACQVACKDKNNLPEGDFFRRVDFFEHEGVMAAYSGACNHCEEPLCIKGCPTGALYKAEDGTVQHHAGKCIGCGACVWNCPYGAPKFSATKGISQKCNACADRRARGEGPACAEACPTHCLRFGEIDMLVSDETPFFLPDERETCPSLVILNSRKKEGV